MNFIKGLKNFNRKMQRQNRQVQQSFAKVSDHSKMNSFSYKKIILLK